MPIRTLLLVMALSADLCAAPPARDFPSAPPCLEHLKGWLCGSFSSAAQAAADTAYFDIRLHMSPIWNERADGPWLYVEQALASTLDQPYRQRVYRLRQTSPVDFVSEVYTLAAPLRFAGAWRNDSLLAGLAQDELEILRGCAVQLRWNAAQNCYSGGTPDEDCASDLRGAAYATSEVTLRADGLLSWERGYDEHGLQVWGPVKGGYDFLRQNEENHKCHR